MKILKITPVILVSSVEKESEVWHLLGFKTTATVPHGKKIGFAILSNKKSELMLQTMPSLKKDLPSVAKLMGKKTTYYFCDVDDLDSIKKKTSKQKLLVDVRKTFYGTREIFIKTDSGEVVGFAEKIK